MDNPKYPEIQKDFEATLATLRALPCDVFVGPHSWDFELAQKIKARAADPSRNPFVDPEGYQRLLDRAQAALREQVEKQRGH